MKIKNVLILLFISANTLLAQEQNWQIKLANGKMIPNVSLQKLEGDSLVISHSGQFSRVAVDDIIEMGKKQEIKVLERRGNRFPIRRGNRRFICGGDL